MAATAVAMRARRELVKNVALILMRGWSTIFDECLVVGCVCICFDGCGCSDGKGDGWLRALIYTFSMLVEGG